MSNPHYKTKYADFKIKINIFSGWIETLNKYNS